jgi:fatty-acyl-CoA synthase
MYIGDWLARREMLTPDKVALIDTLHADRPITYREWNRAANRTAHFLRERCGVQKGDRVAVLAMNGVEYLDVWFACGKLGAVLHNLNWRLTARELAALIGDATSTVLIYGGESTTQVNELRPQSPSVRHYVALNKVAAEGDHHFWERDTLTDAPPPEVELDWNDPWVICYTGGTTGTPKGAVLTHRSITANAVNTVVSWGLTPDDVAVLDAPLFHTGGLNVFTAPLVYVGGTSIVCKRFDPDQTFDLLRTMRVTLYFGVPTMFLMLQQHPGWEEADFTKLKLVISGGAPCPLPVFEKFWARGVDFKTGYGLTEAGPNTFWLPPKDVRAKPGAVGLPLFHVDVKVVRPDGSECEPEELGELVIRGPHVCAGYWNNPAATRAALHPLANTPGSASWLHTGDLARHDAEGYYYIVGRSKDMFISGGENVYPAEVESVLHAHPAVAETAVVGIPHEKWGEVGRAVVVVRPGAHLSESELLDFVRERLAAYKVPKSVVFVSELPKTGANKVDKKLLMEKYSG